jgi:hypothetical protein
MNFTTLAYNALLQVLGIVVISVHHGRRNVPVGAAVLTAGTDEGLGPQPKTYVQKGETINKMKHAKSKRTSVTLY